MNAKKTTPLDNLGDERERELLEALLEDPDVRQIDLATRLGVAVGTVNWLLKRLAAKGLITIKRIGRWQWRYVLTPRGMAQKVKLTQQYVQSSMGLYRRIREDVRGHLESIKCAGYDSVHLEWDTPSDLIDICRLTCLECGVALRSDDRDTEAGQLPSLRIVGKDILVEWPIH